MRHLLAGLILIHISALADLDEHQRKGLSDTKSMMTNRGERLEAIKNDKAAAEMDKKLEALTGPGAEKEDVYGIAAEVLDVIASEAKGDPQKMQQILLEAQSNPEAFYQKYLNNSQKAKVKNLATDIEKKKSPTPSPR